MPRSHNPVLHRPGTAVSDFSKPGPQGHLGSKQLKTQLARSSGIRSRRSLSPSVFSFGESPSLGVFYFFSTPFNEGFNKDKVFIEFYME